MEMHTIYFGQHWICCDASGHQFWNFLVNTLSLDNNIFNPIHHSINDQMNYLKWWCIRNPYCIVAATGRQTSIFHWKCVVCTFSHLLTTHTHTDTSIRSHTDTHRQTDTRRTMCHHHRRRRLVICCYCHYHLTSLNGISHNRNENS